jgi:glycosyltransferase involved in cell wall biosynthesis
MSKLPISVFIITKNEQELIGKAIGSVICFADEVIIVDSGSEDQTVNIATKLGARVIFNPWEGYVNQKIFAESLCKNKWILNIDGDEELSLEFQNNLRKIFSVGDDDKKAYICQMVMVHRLDGVVRYFAPKTSAIRLYHADYAGFKFGDLSSNCHDSVFVKDKYLILGTIKDPILHRSIRSIEQYLSKANYYTSLQAQELFDKSRKVNILRLLLEPFLCFFKYYFLRRYFVFGINGLIDAMIYSFTKFVRLAKLREKYVSRETQG